MATVTLLLLFFRHGAFGYKRPVLFVCLFVLLVFMEFGLSVGPTIIPLAFNSRELLMETGTPDILCLLSLRGRS